MNNIFKKILNEAFYGKKDIDDHEFKYLKNVLNNFETNDPIFLKTKNGNKGVETDITHLKNEEFMNNVTRFQNWLNNTEDNNDNNRLSNIIATSKDNYNSAKNRESLLKAFNDFFCDKDSPLKQWETIEKTDYSIIRTPEQEGIQAIFLAAKLKGKTYFNDIGKLYAPNANINSEECKKLKNLFYENDLGITLTNERIDFSNKTNKEVLKKLANILKINEFPQEFENLKKTEFTIIHPDGLKNNVNVDFAKVLFGEGVKWEVENQGFSLSLKKDNFIPADLYIIPLNKIYDIRKTIKAAGKLDPYLMVALSNDLMNNQGIDDEFNTVKDPLIYPISLKMPSNNPKIEKIINSKNENTIKVGIDNISENGIDDTSENGIHFNPKGNSTMEIKYGGKRLVLEFRSKGKDDKTGKHKPWQCNAKNKDNTNAIEGGSAKDYIKFVFRDRMVGSITEADVDEIVRVFGNKIKIDERVNEIYIQKESVLAKSFKRFFEDEDTVEENEDDIIVEENKVDKKENSSTLTAKDMVLLAVPSDPKVRGESSAKEGNIGLGLFCKKLIENGIEGSGNYNKELSQIVQMSFKMNEIVQDTWKIT